MLALGAELAARGHEVTYETWSRWREHVEDAGMRFVSAPEYQLFPGDGEPFEMYEAVVRATGVTRRAVADARPHVVVHDILTLAPAMAGELEGVPVATLIPHLYPAGAPGFPPYASGARLPRTGLGRRVWAALDAPMQAGLRRGRAELNSARARLGLPPVSRLHGGLSERLCMVATFPQLEYPRTWPRRRARRRPADVGTAVRRGLAAERSGAVGAGGAVDRSGSVAPAAPGRAVWPRR